MKQMITYELDPDVLQWGLHLLGGDPFFNYVNCRTITQHDTDFYDGQYVRGHYVTESGTVENGEIHYVTECSNVENDEIIAHALQEELSQLAVAEVSGSSNAGAAILAQDWVGPSMGNYCSGHEIGLEEADNMGLSGSCSSPGEQADNEDWPYSLQLSDESSPYGVEKSLNQMVRVPHVPRINGEIPSFDEATSDHQRLLDRLRLYELVERKVHGDGNCQFRALSDQLYRTPEHHNFVREQIINQLKSHPEIYEGYVPMAYGDYLEKISKSGEWGDHVTLQAAADSYGVKIVVITSFKDTCYIEILPNIQKSNRVICLSFWAEVHYNSISSEGDVPAFETKKKKGWWIFGN